MAKQPSNKVAAYLCAKIKEDELNSCAARMMRSGAAKQPSDPPAFPAKPGFDPGMSLRDWFKGQAIKGILSNPAMIDNDHPASNEWVAQFAGRIADAMLAESEKGGSA